MQKLRKDDEAILNLKDHYTSAKQKFWIYTFPKAALSRNKIKKKKLTLLYFKSFFLYSIFSQGTELPIIRV